MTTSIPCSQRWQADSVLNRLPQRQTPANALGRSRSDEHGRLRDPAQVQYPGAGERSFLMIEQFLAAPVCDALCAVFADLSRTIVNRVPGFWDSRFIWHSDVMRRCPALAGRMRQTQSAAVAAIATFYRLTAPIYSDLLQIMSWTAGLHMAPHADNANPDGSPHAMAHRDFAGIVYLNDDYRGGELYFTALNTVVKPRTGMLVAFTAGFCHEHAVLRVEGGQRLTMPFFLTFDKSRADAALL